MMGMNVRYGKIQYDLIPTYHLPKHTLGGIELDHLHIETAKGSKAEFDHSADFAFPLRVVGPPPGKTFYCGQCLVGVTWGRRFESDSV